VVPSDAEGCLNDDCCGLLDVGSVGKLDECFSSIVNYGDSNSTGVNVDIK
jgi:hypothetical protein